MHLFKLLIWGLMVCVGFQVGRAEASYAFDWKRSEISNFKGFNPAIHTGLRCDISELDSLEDLGGIGYLWVQLQGNTLRPEFYKKLSKISGLKVLFLSGPIIVSDDFSKIIKTCPSLKALAFLNARIDGLDWPKENKRITGLWISSKDITAIPNSISCDSTIETLILTGSRIRVLDADLSRMISLRKLYLDTSGIEAIGAGFLIPSGVEYISLNGNNIKEIPVFIRTLGGLRNVELMANKIKSIPQWLESLDSESTLKLNLLDNDIMHIPPFVSKHPERFELSQPIEP